MPDLHQFGFEFLCRAVTPDRVAAAVTQLVGERLTVGPVNVGPGGLATARADGHLGEVFAEREPDEPCRQSVWIPLALRVTVRLGLEVTTFTAHVVIRLGVGIEPETPLGIVVRVDEPGPDDVTLRLSATKVTRGLLGLVHVTDELNHHVRRYVRDVLDSPEAERFLRIDLEGLIDRACDDLFGLKAS
jgi:hypothetical protein